MIFVHKHACSSVGRGRGFCREATESLTRGLLKKTL